MKYAVRPSFRLIPLIAALLASPAIAFTVGMPAMLGTEELDSGERVELESVVREEIRASFPSESWEMMSADLLGLSLEQKNLRPAACADETCFAELGRALGLDVFIMGYFRRSSEEDRVLLKLYDMNSGKMEGFIRVAGSGAGTLRNSLPEACHRLLHPYRGWKPAEETPLAAEDTEGATEAWSAQGENEVKTLVGNEKAKSPVLPALGRRSSSLLDTRKWSFGIHGSTFSGASHSILLNEINDAMSRWEGGSLLSPFINFDVGNPLGGKVRWHFRGPIAFSGSYFFTRYETGSTFYAFEWESDRTLVSDLHEFQFTLEYSLSFMKSRTIDPFLGAGVIYFYADSHLDIDLDNVNEASNGAGDIYPNKSFRVESGDTSLGATAFVGINYNLSRNLTLQGILAGTMGQVTQHFEYDGSLQYYSPNTPEDITDKTVNFDILYGSHPFDLNGLRLSIGLLFSL